jgi:hypothetical protein
MLAVVLTASNQEDPARGNIPEMFSMHELFKKKAGRALNSFTPFPKYN